VLCIPREPVSFISWPLLSTVTSNFPRDYLPHGEQDPFDPDPDNPADPLHNLLPLVSPRFFQGCLCAVKNCSYLTYLHPLCAACFKQKFKLGVKRTTSRQGGLGPFASSTLEAKPDRVSDISQMNTVERWDPIINFCIGGVKEIDEQECTS